MDKHKGKLTISRLESNFRNDRIAITIQDESSRTLVVEAIVPLTEFAQALTGLGCVSVEFEHGDSRNIGKRREHISVPTSDAQEVANMGAIGWDRIGPPRKTNKGIEYQDFVRYVD